MAYLQDKTETVETDFPLNKVWKTIKQSISRFECTIEAMDKSTHYIKAKTRELCFLSCATVLSIEAKAVSEK